MRATCPCGNILLVVKEYEKSITIVCPHGCRKEKTFEINLDKEYPKWV